MEIPDLKSDIHRTLLGPLSFATELFGAFLPGCALTLLVSNKRGWVSSALSYPLLGYKTKLVLAAFASYIVGKAILGSITLVQDLITFSQQQAKREKAGKAGTQVATAPNLLSSLVTHINIYIDQAPD